MEMFNELADLHTAKAALYRHAVRVAFQTVALKAVTALADEASDHAKEWAEQSAAFLGQVFAAKTPVKAAEI